MIEPPDNSTEIFSACNNLGLRTCATEGSHNADLSANSPNVSFGKASFGYTSFRGKVLRAHQSLAPINLVPSLLFISGRASMPQARYSGSIPVSCRRVSVNPGNNRLLNCVNSVTGSG